MFSELHALISNPTIWKVLIVYWVFSAMVGALPTPETDSPKIYVFVFRFFHLLSGNVNRAAIALKLPPVVEEEQRPISKP